MANDYYKRGFLNKDRGSASFEAEILLYRGEVSSAEFNIKDCTRAVCLDFSYSTEAQREAKLEKLDVLVEALIKFRENL